MLANHITENYSDCKSRNLFACTEIVSGHCSAAMPDWKRLTIQERLRVLRKMQGLSQGQFAAEIGAIKNPDDDTDAYGKAERTGNIAQMAPAIYRRFPEIDAGWLFQGLTGNVSQATEKRLSEAYSALAVVHSRRSRN